MMKRVGMFVWNHFTNDARVLRIGSTLSHDEYIVHLFCIADPTNQHLKRYEKINSYFEVFRLRRFPLVLTFLETGMTFLVQRKGWAIVCLAVWLFLMYWHPIIILFISLCLVLMLKTKMKVFIIRVSLIGRMIVKGYRGHYDIYHAHDLNTLLQAYVCAKWRFR